MALARVRSIVEIGDEVIKMRGRLASFGQDKQYLKALHLDGTLIPFATTLSPDGSSLPSVIAEFNKDIKTLDAVTPDWFKPIFWKGKLARTGDDTLTGTAAQAIDRIIRYMRQALKKQKTLSTILQKTGLQNKGRVAVAQYYFFILGQIVTAANEEYTKSEKRLRALVTLLEAALRL